MRAMRKIGLAALFATVAVTWSSTAVADPGALVLDDAAGVRHQVKDFRGKWVLINYWATWCAACIEEMPALANLAAEEPRLSVLGVTDETITLSELRLFEARHPVGYLLGKSEKEKIPRDVFPSVLGVQVRPMSFLISPDGRVARRYIGTLDIAKLKILLADQPL